MEGAECRSVGRTAAQRMARVTDIRQGQRAETTRHSTPEHAERALEGLVGESAATRKNRCTKSGDHETNGKAASERGAGQQKTTRNNTRTEPKETAGSAPGPLMSSAFTAIASCKKKELF